MKKQGRLPRMGKCNKTALWSSEAMKNWRLTRKKKREKWWSGWGGEVEVPKRKGLSERDVVMWSWNDAFNCSLVRRLTSLLDLTLLCTSSTYLRDIIVFFFSNMKLTFATLLVLPLALAGSLKSVIVTFPKGTPDSVVNQAKVSLVASVRSASLLSWGCYDSELTLLGWRHHAWVP